MHRPGRRSGARGSEDLPRLVRGHREQYGRIGSCSEKGAGNREAPRRLAPRGPRLARSRASACARATSSRSSMRPVAPIEMPNVPLFACDASTREPLLLTVSSRVRNAAACAPLRLHTHRPREPSLCCARSWGVGCSSRRSRRRPCSWSRSHGSPHSTSRSRCTGQRAWRPGRPRRWSRRRMMTIPATIRCL